MKAFLEYILFTARRAFDCRRASRAQAVARLRPAHVTRQPVTQVVKPGSRRCRAYRVVFMPGGKVGRVYVVSDPAIDLVETSPGEQSLGSIPAASAKRSAYAEERPRVPRRACFGRCAGSRHKVTTSEFLHDVCTPRQPPRQVRFPNRRGDQLGGHAGYAAFLAAWAA